MTLNLNRRTLKTILKEQSTMHQLNTSHHFHKQDRIVSKASNLKTFWMAWKKKLKALMR